MLFECAPHLHVAVVVFPECVQSRQAQLYKLCRAGARAPLSERILMFHMKCLDLIRVQRWPHDSILNSPFYLLRFWAHTSHNVRRGLTL